jgi:predicted ATPase
MLRALAIANYRSIRDLILPLGALNLVTGPNGSGKSNLYRALDFWLTQPRAELLLH